MKKRLIISILAGAAVMPVVAQINSTGNDGYLKRGEAMYADRNYTGCIDQLTRLDRAALSESEREESDWLIAMANFNVSGRAAKPHFVAFLSMYPYSLHRQQALMRIGDCLFETSFADALKVYQMVNPDALPAAEADELAYREGYCRLQLADFDAASSRFSSLLSSRRYANAARFYLGYIAYVKGDYSEAKRLFKDVDTSAEPGNMADYYLSQIYFVDGDYNRALSTAKSLLRRNDSRADFVAEANRIAGESLYHTGRGSEAIGYLKKYRAAVENPSLSTLYILGLAEYEQGDYARAIEALEPVSAMTVRWGRAPISISVRLLSTAVTNRPRFSPLTRRCVCLTTLKCRRRPSTTTPWRSLTAPRYPSAAQSRHSRNFCAATPTAIMPPRFRNISSPAI